MLSVLKNASSPLIIILLFLNGCTIHNRNVTASDTPPQTPVAINTMGNAGGSSTSPKRPVPIAEMGSPTTPTPSLASVSSLYSIHAGDDLDIKFFYNPKLNESVTVRPDGHISLQLVQDVQAASLSTSELVAVLKKKYSSYLKDPEISVIVRSFESNKVYVDGEVRKSGMVEMSGDMTIMQSIAGAGGLKETARRGDVLLIRRNGLKRPFVYTVNLNAAMAGTDISQNVVLKPYDIVYVPKSVIANVNTWVDQYIRKNIPINVGYELNNVID